MVSPGEQGSSASKTESKRSPLPPSLRTRSSTQFPKTILRKRTLEVNWETVIQCRQGADRGAKAMANRFTCTYCPCPASSRKTACSGLTFQNLAWQTTTDMYVFHDGRVNKIDYLQKNSFQDFVIVERILNRQRNKNVWSLSDRIEQRIFDRLYLYDQTPVQLSEGIPSSWRCTNTTTRNAKDVVFRYHQSGYRYPFDIALTVPINRA